MLIFVETNQSIFLLSDQWTEPNGGLSNNLMIYTYNIIHIGVMINREVAKFTMKTNEWQKKNLQVSELLGNEITID